MTTDTIKLYEGVMMTGKDALTLYHASIAADHTPALLAACQAIDAAFPATLHRNGAQVAALAAVKAAIAQVQA